MAVQSEDARLTLAERVAGLEHELAEIRGTVAELVRETGLR